MITASEVIARTDTHRHYKNITSTANAGGNNKIISIEGIVPSLKTGPFRIYVSVCLFKESPIHDYDI